MHRDLIRDRLGRCGRPRVVHVAGPDSAGRFGPGAERSPCLRLLLGLAGDADHELILAGRRRRVALPLGVALVAPPGHPIEAGGSADGTTVNLLIDDDLALLRVRDRATGDAPTVACSGPALGPLPGLARALAALPGGEPREALLRDSVDLLRRHALVLLAGEAVEATVAPGGAFAAACGVIMADLAADLSRGAVASAVGVHPNHLSRLFRREAGMGLGRWIAERRLERAARLIREGLLGVGEAGRPVGFSSPAVFAQVCRRLRGCRPGEL